MDEKEIRKIDIPTRKVRLLSAERDLLEQIDQKKFQIEIFYAQLIFVQEELKKVKK